MAIMWYCIERTQSVYLPVDINTSITQQATIDFYLADNPDLPILMIHPLTNDRDITIPSWISVSALRPTTSLTFHDR